MNKITTLFSLLALLDIADFYSYEYQPESSGVKTTSGRKKKNKFFKALLYLVK
jgi:hypothetical protein